MPITILSSKPKIVLCLSGLVYGTHATILDELNRLGKKCELHVHIDTWDYAWNTRALDQFKKEYKKKDRNFKVYINVLSYTDDIVVDAVKEFLGYFGIKFKGYCDHTIFRKVISLLIHKIAFDNIHQIHGDDIPVIRTRAVWEFDIKESNLIDKLFHTLNSYETLNGHRLSAVKNISSKDILISNGVSSSYFNDSQYITYSQTGKRLFSNIIKSVAKLYFTEGLTGKYKSQSSLSEDIGPTSSLVSYASGWQLYFLAQINNVLVDSDINYIFGSLGSHSYRVKWPFLGLSNGKVSVSKENSFEPEIIYSKELPLMTGYLLT